MIEIESENDRNSQLQWSRGRTDGHYVLSIFVHKDKDVIKKYYTRSPGREGSLHVIIIQYFMLIHQSNFENKFWLSVLAPKCPNHTKVHS